MTEQEAKDLMQNRRCRCDYRFLDTNFLDDLNPDSDYRKQWLWHERCYGVADIWIDYEEMEGILAIMDVSPHHITDPVYIKKWVRRYVQKRPSFDFDNMRDELYEEIERLVGYIFDGYFSYYPESFHWGVCDPDVNKPKHEYTDMFDLQQNYDKFCYHFNLDVWKQVIMDYKVPVLTAEQAHDYQRTIQRLQDRIRDLEAEVKALSVHRTENHYYDQSQSIDNSKNINISANV